GDKAFILKHWYMGPSSDPALVLEARDACTRSWKASGDLSIEAEARLAHLELRFRFGRAIELTSSEAQAEIDRVEALLEDIPDQALAARLSYLSTSTRLDAGELELADARMRGTEQTASDQLAGPLWRSIAVQLIGEIRYQQGRLGELAGLAQQLLDDARTGLEVVAWCGAVAQSQFALGHLDEVHHALDRAISTLRTQDVKAFAWGYVMSWLAEPAASVGHDTALAWCRELLSAEPATAVGYGATHGTTDLWLAMIDTMLGAPESADALFASAEEQCLRLELPLWVNLTRCFWAASLLGRDDARSRQLAGTAADDAKRRGQHVVTARAQALLDTTG